MFSSLSERFVVLFLAFMSFSCVYQIYIIAPLTSALCFCFKIFSTEDQLLEMLFFKPWIHSFCVEFIKLLPRRYCTFDITEVFLIVEIHCPIFRKNTPLVRQYLWRTLTGNLTNISAMWPSSVEIVTLNENREANHLKGKAPIQMWDIREGSDRRAMKWIKVRRNYRTVRKNASKNL